MSSVSIRPITNCSRIEAEGLLEVTGSHLIIVVIIGLVVVRKISTRDPCWSRAGIVRLAGWVPHGILQRERDGTRQSTPVIELAATYRIACISRSSVASVVIDITRGQSNLT